MSNPRRFGKVILHRVTESMTLNKAKKEAAKIRKSGRQARVDTYQGKYAVWSIKSKLSAVKKSKATRKLVTIYHGTTSNNLSSIVKTGYVLGYWTKVREQAVMFALGYSDGHKCTYTHPIILEAKVPESHITGRDGWTQIYEFQAEKSLKYKKVKRGTGDILNVRYISGVLHFRLCNNGINVHTDDYLLEGKRGEKFVTRDWVRKSLKESISYVPKDRDSKKGKMITLYHGTLSSKLPLIRRSKKVIGQWTKDPVFAAQFAVKEEAESSLSEKGKPILIVSKVPEDIIIWDDYDYEVVEAFNIKGGQTKLDKSLSHTGSLKTSEVTGVLPIRYVSHVLHIKRSMFIDKFDRKDWVKRKL